MDVFGRDPESLVRWAKTGTVERGWRPRAIQVPTSSARPARVADPPERRDPLPAGIVLALSGVAWGTSPRL
jgi:hypothetical protein